MGWDLKRFKHAVEDSNILQQQNSKTKRYLEDWNAHTCDKRPGVVDEEEGGTEGGSEVVKECDIGFQYSRTTEH